LTKVALYNQKKFIPVLNRAFETAESEQQWDIPQFTSYFLFIAPLSLQTSHGQIGTFSRSGWHYRFCPKINSPHL
jgi:hypothetical protein